MPRTINGNPPLIIVPAVRMAAAREAQLQGQLSGMQAPMVVVMGGGAAKLPTFKSLISQQLVPTICAETNIPLSDWEHISDRVLHLTRHHQGHSIAALPPFRRDLSSTLGRSAGMQLRSFRCSSQTNLHASGPARAGLGFLVVGGEVGGHLDCAQTDCEQASRF